MYISEENIMEAKALNIEDMDTVTGLCGGFTVCCRNAVANWGNGGGITGGKGTVSKYAGE